MTNCSLVCSPIRCAAMAAGQSFSASVRSCSCSCRRRSLPMVGDHDPFLLRQVAGGSGSSAFRWRRRFWRRRTLIRDLAGWSRNAPTRRTVQAAEQLFRAMIRSSQLAITLHKNRHQFTDQAVAARYIGWHLNVQRHGFLHHAPETRDAMKKFLESKNLLC